MHNQSLAPLGGLALMTLVACGQQNGTHTSATGTASPAPTTAAAGPLSSDQLPHQKAGLWRTTMAVEGMSRSMPATEMCLDAATEARMSVWSKTARDGGCSTSQFTRNLDGSIGFKTACDLGPGGKRMDSGTIVGDFNAAYKVSIDSTTTGAAVPSVNGEHKMSVEATWVGPCAPGQKGGDMIMPDGKTINMGG